MNNVSCILVHEFDYTKFSDSCFPSLPTYVKDLSTYDIICAEICHVGDVWKSRDLLASVLKVIAKQHGWKSQLYNTQLKCNRF